MISITTKELKIEKVFLMDKKVSNFCILWYSNNRRSEKYEIKR